MIGERVRFSPSPTGSLHIGGARTALYNWLVARKTGGAFIVRLEDTDPERVVPGADEVLLEELRWLGLDWDEGPDIGGPHAPYRQSERLPLYRKAAEALVSSGAVYPCYCTPEELAASRAAASAAGKPPRYPGTCRALSAPDRDRLSAEGRSAAWRFAVPEGATVAFGDAVHGDVSFCTDDIGDFIVMRSDGRPTYDLACVVDDAAMGVTFVIRGDDHLSNTARQLLLARALGISPPRYAHIPLVTAPGGEPLSKSKGASAVSELKKAGYLPSAVVEHVASLGWRLPAGIVIAGPADLVTAFDIARVSRSPSVHDPERLRATNARHMRRLAIDELLHFVLPFLPSLPEGVDRRALVAMAREESQTAAGVAAFVESIVKRPSVPCSLSVDAIAAASAAADALGERWDPAAFTAAFRAELAARGVAVKEGMHALRIALIGRPEGPPVAELLRVLGQHETQARIAAAALTVSAASSDSGISSDEGVHSQEA